MVRDRRNRPHVLEEREDLFVSMISFNISRKSSKIRTKYSGFQYAGQLF